MPELTEELNEQSMIKAMRMVTRFNAHYLRLNELFPAFSNIEDDVQVDKKLRLMQAIDSCSRRLSQNTFQMNSEIREWIVANRVVGFSDIDMRNTEELKTIIERGGWPGMTARASKAAWLIVQHADHVPDFQKEILDKYGRFMDPRDAAFLYDRIATQPYKADTINGYENSEELARSPDAPKQRFGTQGRYVGNDWIPYPIEDEVNLEHRRASIGLKPMVEYMHAFKPLNSVLPEPQRN